MTRLSLDLLVLADLHYIHAAEDVCTIKERRCELGPALIRAAFQDVHKAGVRPDLLVLLGDLVNNGLAPGAGDDMVELIQVARETGLQVLALPGNHDGGYKRFVEQWGCAPGLHEVGGYGFLIYHDDVAADDVTTRPAEALALPEQVARRRPDLPLVALQHNPLHPPIEHEYPFILANADLIQRGYHEGGVILSLSGHYHPGQAAHAHQGTVYATLAAGCEAPFWYAHVRLRGREVEVHARALEE